MYGEDFINVNAVDEILEENKAIARRKCEKAILEKLEEIVKIYHKYHPEGKHLTLFLTNGNLYVNNSYFDFEDCENPIHAQIYEGKFEQCHTYTREELEEEAMADAMEDDDE